MVSQALAAKATATTIQTAANNSRKSPRYGILTRNLNTGYLRNG
jgi:hypothetical protein